MVIHQRAIVRLILITILAAAVRISLLPEAARTAETASLPLPKEISKIKPEKVALQDQTVRPWFPKAAIGKADEADVWLSVKADSTWKVYDPAVVYCSAPGFKFEDMAKMVALLTTVAPVKGYRADKPSRLYLLISFSYISGEEVFDSLPKPEQLLRIDSPVKLIGEKSDRLPLGKFRIDDYADGNPVLKIFVNEGGLARRIRLTVPSGVGLPDSMAVVQARLMKYQPAMSGGKPVGTWVTWPFSIKGSRYQ